MLQNSKVRNYFSSLQIRFVAPLPVINLCSLLLSPSLTLWLSLPLIITKI